MGVLRSQECSHRITNRIVDFHVDIVASMFLRIGPKTATKEEQSRGLRWSFSTDQRVWLMMIGSDGKISLFNLDGKSENRTRGQSKIWTKAISVQSYDHRYQLTACRWASQLMNSRSSESWSLWVLMYCQIAWIIVWRVPLVSESKRAKRDSSLNCGG